VWRELQCFFSVIIFSIAVYLSLSNGLVIFFVSFRVSFLLTNSTARAAPLKRQLETLSAQFAHALARVCRAG